MLLMQLLLLLAAYREGVGDEHDSNVFFQHLPDCSAGGFDRLEKKSAAKGILCPMIRDEEVCTP